MEKLWRTTAESPMSLWAMTELCKKMHEGAPFHNFNGNTFSALAVEASTQIDCPDRFLLEDAICSAVAGTIGQKTEEDLRKFSEKLEGPTNDQPETEIC